MNKNIKMLVGLSLVASAILIMFFATMPSAGSKEIRIKELNEKRSDFQGQFVLTQGLLKQETVKWDADMIQLQFEIYDQENSESLTVVYNGVQPDNFSEEVIVIVEGELQKDGFFHAEKVQTKCPSKYEGEDMEDYDEDMHKEIYRNEDR